MKSAFIFLLLSITLTTFSQNGPLYFSSGENTRVALHSGYFCRFEAKDSLNRTLIYSPKDLPPWMKFDAVQNSISGKAPKTGQYPVQLMVTNGKDTATLSYMLTVYDKKTVNILPLGNSITNGTSIYNSYRRDLWQLLHQGNYNFDFIGSWNKHHMGGKMPDTDFDLDHEGHSGWTLGHILHAPDWDSARGDIHDWLKVYTPDIVLMELGTNDVFQCVKLDTAMKNLSLIVKELRNKNRNVKIFIAQIPPLGNTWALKKLCGTDTPYGQVLTTLNKLIVNYAAANSTAQSPVIAVDQYSGVDPATDMYDDIHPNLKGEKIMADRWFNAIKNFVPKLK
jgi:lysophospholipase L1-like esterase